MVDVEAPSVFKGMKLKFLGKELMEIDEAVSVFLDSNDAPTMYPS